MRALIHIGGKVDEAGVLAAADAVAQVLQTAFDSHADQETVRHALDALARFAQVENVSIANCHLTGPV